MPIICSELTQKCLDIFLWLFTFYFLMAIYTLFTVKNFLWVLKFTQICMLAFMSFYTLFHDKKAPKMFLKGSLGLQYAQTID